MNLKKSKTAKLFAGALGLTMALSFALPASAATTAELTAQINSLFAMIGQLQAQIVGGSAASVTFTSNLTVGSKGSDVTALQQWLVSKGYLTMPAGASMGYFGKLTKMALAKYQADAGISPASGYFGPITRAKLNAMVSTTTTGGTTGGTTTTTTTTTTATTTATTTPGITTLGAEGTVSVTGSNAGALTTVYAGDMKDKILGFKIQALGSDVAFQRVKVDLGTNTTQYNKIWSTLYVLDASGNVLGSLPLNSVTVVKDSGTYYATIAGFTSIVPKGSNLQYYIAADLYGTIDTTNQTSYTVQLANSGVRARDGAGIDQFSPTTGSNVNSSITVAANLTDSATLTISSDPSTPPTSSVTANQGSSNDRYDLLPLLTFGAKATKDSVQITDVKFEVVKSGAGAANASTTLYLYDGSTPIGTGTLTSSTTAVTYWEATFSNLNYTIPKDVTKVLSLRTDIRSANITAANFYAIASSSYFTAQSSNGTSVTAANKSGVVTGNTITVRNNGPVITLTSKSIATAGVPQGAPFSGGTSTSTLTATFNFRITAVGGAITFGTSASGTPAFASSTTGFRPYVGGSSNSIVGGVSTSTSWNFPAVCSTSGLTNSCTLSENNSMDVAVTYQIFGRNTAGTANPLGLYSIGVEGVQWQGTNAQSSTFMSGLNDWRTADVSFP